MTTMKVNIRKAREKFSEIINTVAVKGERIILTSKNIPKAAIVSLRDIETLEDKDIKKARRLFHLEQMRKIREKLAQKSVTSDSTSTLRKMRSERIEKLSNSH